MTAPARLQRSPTAAQRRVLDYLVSYFIEHDRLPAAAVVAHALGWKSINSAEQHMRALRSRGYLEKDGGRYRFARTWLSRPTVIKHEQQHTPET